MGTVSVSLPADGSTADVADYNTPITTLTNEFNGNIDNNNIKSGAGIDGSKLASASVPSTKIDFGGAGAGVWWQEIGRTTLVATATSISVTSFTAKKYLKIVGWLPDNGSAIVGSITFNNDSSTNYAITNSTAGAGDTATASQSSFIVAVDSAATPRYFEIELVNTAAKEKLIVGHCISQNTAGAANTPLRRELNGKWANTSAQITRVDASTGTANSFAIGAEIIVMGHD